MVFDPIDLFARGPEPNPDHLTSGEEDRRVVVVASSPLVESVYIQLLCPTMVPGVRAIGLAGEVEDADRIGCLIMILDTSLNPEALIERCAEITTGRNIRIICIHETGLAEAAWWVRDLEVFMFLKAGVPSRVLGAAVTLAGHVDDYSIPLSVAGQQPSNPLDAAKEAAVSILTTRQLDVLRLLAQGCSNKAIASALLISEPTVKLHLSALRRIFQASNRTEVLVKASRQGLFPLLDSQQSSARA